MLETAATLKRTNTVPFWPAGAPVLLTSVFEVP
jgi:hypothetical protein